MREIKFRGKPRDDVYDEPGIEYLFRKDTFVFGSLVFDGENPIIAGHMAHADGDYIALEWWVEVDPETIGQYTGLTDKHGVEIWEGDIVRAPFYNEYGIVEFGDVGYGLFDGTDGFCDDIFRWEDWEAFEVVGNKHTPSVYRDKLMGEAK